MVMRTNSWGTRFISLILIVALLMCNVAYVSLIDVNTVYAEDVNTESDNTKDLKTDSSSGNSGYTEEIGNDQKKAVLDAVYGEKYIYLVENTMPEEIYANNVFYVATNSADLNENANQIYLFKIGRGGDTSEAASVTLKISDFTAKYGQDYKIRIHGHDATEDLVHNPQRNQSLVEMIQSTGDITEIPMGGEEEAGAILASQIPDPQPQAESIILAPETNEVKAGGGQQNPANTDGQELVQQSADLKAENSDQDIPKEIEAVKRDNSAGLEEATELTLPEPVKADLTERPVEAAVVPEVDGSTLAGAKQLFTGLPSDRMPMTSTGDMAEQLRQMGDYLTTAVIGATLKLDFASGESEKYLEIETINNNEGDGNRSFMIVLSATEGNVSNSLISNAMFTIVDDEAKELAQLSFKVNSIEADEDKAVIEICRTGAINTTVGATLRTEAISAVAGRDFAPVNASVVFPFGIKTRTLEIPVQKEGINQTVSFKVILEKPVGCQISGTGEAQISISPPVFNRVSAMKVENNSLQAMGTVTTGSRVLGTAVNLANPGYTANDGGSSRSYYSNGVFELSGDDHARVFWCWAPNQPNKTFYDYSGLSVDWALESGKPAYPLTRLEANIGDTGNSRVWTDLVNTETERWGRSTHDYYYGKAGVSEIAFHQNDRDGYWPTKQSFLKIYSIKPILRPFEVSLQAADSLNFLDENGNQVANPAYTSAKLENTNADGKAVKFSGDTIQISAANNGMTRLVGVNLVKAGKQPRRIVNVAAGATVATFAFTSQFAADNHDYMTFSANGSQGLKGAFTLQPVFEYYNATVRVYKHDKGHFNVSGGNNFNISVPYQDFTYHLGDTIKLSTMVNNLYSANYKAASVKYAFKPNALNSNQSWGTWGYNKNSNTTYSYFINNEYTELTPVIEKKDNKIVVRVRKTELIRFNPNYGIFNAASSAGRIDNGDYWDYTVMGSNDTLYKKDYIFMARPGSENLVPVWKEIKTGKRFSGNVFYYNAWDTKEDNVIELSLSANQQYYSLKGSMYYNNYNLATGRSSAAWLPASGGLVAANGASSMVDDKGAFQTTPFVGVKDTYVRYLAACDGKSVYKEYGLPASGTIANVSVPIVDSQGNTSTRTYSTMSLNTGNVIIPVDSNDTPVFSGVMAVNAGHVSVGSASIYINDTTTDLSAQISNDGIAYVKPNGQTAAEKVTAVNFLVYDGKTNALKTTIPAAKVAGVWTASKKFELDKPAICAPGDKLFVQMTTDRVAVAAIANYDNEGNRIDTDPEAQALMQKTVYAPVFTGYMLVTTAAKEPVSQNFALPTNAKFMTLPLIGEMNSVFKIANISLSIEELPGKITRLKFGYVVTNKWQSKNAGQTDNGVDYGVEDWSSFKAGLAKSYKDSLDTYIPKGSDQADQLSSFGAKQWGIYPVVGVYIDFGLSYITDANGIDGPTQFEFMGGGAFLGGIATYKVAWYALMPVVFVPCYFGVAGQLSLIFDIGASADPNSTLTYDGIKTTGYELNKEFKFDAALRACAYIQIYAGVGICGTMGVRGGVQVDANFIWYPTVRAGYSNNGLGLSFTLKFWVDALLFSIPIPAYTYDKLKFGYFKEISNEKKNASLRAFGDEQLSRNQLEVSLKEFNDQPSSWLPRSSGIRLRGAFTPHASVILNENGYDRPDGQLLDLGNGKTLLVFLDKDTTRSDLEKTVLKYSVYDNGTWSQPVVIQNDGTADFQPNLCDGGDNAIISWMSSDPAVAKTGDPNQYLGCQEIYTTLLNKATLQVGTIERLTEDGFYDYEPVAMYDDNTGDRAVYFIKSSLKDSFVASVDSTSNDCVIVYMLYDAGQGKWLRDYYYPNELARPEDEAILIANWKGQRFLTSPIDELNMTDPLIVDFNAVSYNGIGVYAYTVDKDNSKDTNTDRELFVQVYDFSTHKTYKPIRITDDAVADSMPQLVRRGSGAGAATYLFWLQEDRAVRYINLSDLVKNGIESNGTITAGYELNYGTVSMNASLDDENKHSLGSYKAAVDKDGNMYVIWLENVSDLEQGTHCVEIYATAFIKDANGSNWAPPYRLTQSNMYNDEPAISIDSNGKMILVHNQYAMQFTEDDTRPVEISDLKLMAASFEPCGAVEVSGLEFSDTTPEPGSEITVSALAVNKGLTVADGYRTDFHALRNGILGELVSTQESPTRLVPGAKEQIRFTWTLPAEINGLAIRAVARENGLPGEFSADSAELKVTPVYELSGADLYQSDDVFYARMSIKNTGNAPANPGDMVKVRYNLPYTSAQSLGIAQEIFAAAPIGELVPGESRDYNLKLDIPASAFEKYAFTECHLAVYESTAEKIISNELDQFLFIEKPVDLKLNHQAPLGTLAMQSGQTTQLNLSYAPAARFSAGTVVYSVENPDIVRVNGNTLTAVNPGTTTLCALVAPYGSKALYTVSVSYPGGGGGSSGSSSSNDKKDKDKPEPVPDPKPNPEPDPKPNPTENPASFTDIGQHWAQDTIGKAVERGIFKGYGDGSFRPDAPITRAEFLCILYNSGLDNVTAGDDPNLTDVAADSWYYEFVKWGVARGISRGYQDKSFGADNPISREEMAVMLSNFMALISIDLAAKSGVKFTDDKNISGWAKEHLDKLVAGGILKGYPDGSYQPKNNLTRAEAATIIMMIIELVSDRIQPKA